MGAPDNPGQELEVLGRPTCWSASSGDELFLGEPRLAVQRGFQRFTQIGIHRRLGGSETRTHGPF